MPSKKDVTAYISNALQQIRSGWTEDVYVLFTIRDSEEVLLDCDICLYDGCDELKSYRMDELQEIKRGLPDLTSIKIRVSKGNYLEYRVIWNRKHKQLNLCGQIDKPIDQPVSNTVQSEEISFDADIQSTVQFKTVVDLPSDSETADLLATVWGDDFDFTVPTIDPLPVIPPIEIIEQPATTIQPTEVIESEQTTVNPIHPIAKVEEKIDLTLPLDDLGLKVFVSVKDSEGLTVKKETSLRSHQLLPLLDAWLLATGKKSEFLTTLKQKKHNALVLYNYPALEWFIQPVKKKTEVTFEAIYREYVAPICKRLKQSPLSVEVIEEVKKIEPDSKIYREMAQIHKSMVEGTALHHSIRVTEEIVPQLRSREDISEKVAQITNRAGSIIQRSQKDALPVIGSLFHISPIKTVDDKGNIYLTQTYLKRIDYDWIQSYHNIAIFRDGKLIYYTDIVRDDDDKIGQAEAKKLGIDKLIQADGINIFPDLSLRMIGLEYLRPVKGGYWANDTRIVLRDNANQPLSAEKSAEIIRDLDIYGKKGVNLEGVLCNHLGVPVREERFLVPPVKFQGFIHPNLKVKAPRVQIKTEQKVPKPAKIDGSKTAPGSLMIRAIIGHIPMLLTVEPSDNQWAVIALPIRVPQYDLSVYLSDKLSRRDLAVRIDSYITELKRLVHRNEIQIKLLDNLLTRVLDGDLPTRQEVIASTKVLEKYLNNEHIKQKSAYSNNYYRLYTLGYTSIIQKVETQYPTYKLDILGDEKDTRRSEIPTAIRWLKNQPAAIQKHFAEITGSDAPSFTEIKKFLMATFPYHKSVTMIISDREKMVIQLFYNNKLQTEQRLTIIKPVSEEKNRGKLPVSVTTRLTWTNDTEFKNLLRCGIDDSQLMIGARAQIESITQKFINSNIRRFVGEEKVITVKPVKEIVGFGKEARNYGSIQKTFYQFTTPFTSESEVELGKIVNLHTLEVYDRHDVTQLLQLMTANFKQWHRNKPEKIYLGGEEFKPIDPGRLMIQVFNRIKNTPRLDTVIWNDLLNELYQMTKLSIGFRCNNGVLLTPWDILPDKADLWAYRLKIQYIDILYKGKKSKIELAQYFLNQDNEDLQAKGKELRDEGRIGQIQSWLEYSLESIEAQLNTAYPTWQSDISENLQDHIAALKNAYQIASRIQ